MTLLCKKLKIVVVFFHEYEMQLIQNYKEALNVHKPCKGLLQTWLFKTIPITVDVQIKLYM